MADTLRIDRTTGGAAAELAVTGRLDAGGAERLSAALDDEVRRGNYLLDLDLSAVDYLSSAGIRALLKSYKQVRGLGGSLAVTRASEQVQYVLGLVGMTALLAETGEAPPGVLTAAPAIASGTVSPDGVDLVVDTLDAAATMRCRTVGDPRSLTGGPSRPPTCVREIMAVDRVAVGLGAIGRDLADCLDRFGECLAVGGAVVYLPTGRSARVDYSLAEGRFVPEAQLVYGLVCEGDFSHRLRFQATDPDGEVSLGTIARLALQAAGAERAALVVVGEVAGLVGASLLRSPLSAAAAESLFQFPQARDALSFTTERSYAGTLTLAAGVIASVGDGPETAFLRPLAPEGSLLGHLHCAVFPFQPLPKDYANLPQIVGRLFDGGRIETVLHLLNDGREITGVGESAWLRGACWVAPLDEEDPA